MRCRYFTPDLNIHQPRTSSEAYIRAHIQSLLTPSDYRTIVVFDQARDPSCIIQKPLPKAAVTEVSWWCVSLVESIATQKETVRCSSPHAPYFSTPLSCPLLAPACLALLGPRLKRSDHGPVLPRIGFPHTTQRGKYAAMHN